MNFFELGGIVGILGGAVWGATVGAPHGAEWAIAGAVAGGAVGFVAGTLGSVALAFVVSGFIEVGHWWRPMFPPCHGGVCKRGDFSGTPPDQLTDEEKAAMKAGSGSYFTCKCGHRYMLSASWNELLTVLPENRVAPYMRTRPFRRRWTTASGPPRKVSELR